MTKTNTFVRSLSDVGLAAWFGGTLANAVALNKAATPTESGTAEAVVVGWMAWTPINLVAIGAYVIGGTGVLLANKARVVGQQGVAPVSVVRTGVLIAALGATAYSRVVGQRVIARPSEPVVDGLTTLRASLVQQPLDPFPRVVPLEQVLGHVVFHPFVITEAATAAQMEYSGRTGPRVAA